MEPFVRPTLSPGDALRIVAPSGPFDEASFDAGVAFLRTRYEVRVDDEVRAKKGYLAGDDARRLAELRRALDEEGTRAIVCARGGFGATRLLGGLDVAQVAHAKKLLVGFSDVTALHALWARARVGSLHGPMVAWLGRATDDARADWAAALEGRTLHARGLRAFARGRTEGILLGGNLAVLASLVGTPYAPPLEGVVLFLEEVGEAPYRIDRMITQLRHARWFDGVRAVVLGDLVRCAPGDHGVTAEEVIAERLGDLGVPVLAGLCAGHGETNHALPFGARVVVDADAGTLVEG
jgi:muramoyltetrapeptide carboxypeptidase